MPETAVRPILLLTRPERQSQRFAAEFGARFGADWPVAISPLSRLEHLSPQVTLNGVGALIFTSETGVTAFARLTARRDLPVFCVGPRTAAAARAAGFDAADGPGEAQGLARLVLASKPRGPLLYVRGTHVAADLADVLSSAGIETYDCIVYDQAAQPLTDDAVEILRGGDAVLLPAFSSRGAAALAGAMPKTHAPLLFAAISPAAMTAGAGLAPLDAAIAPTPDAGGMLTALGRLIDAFRELRSRGT